MNQTLKELKESILKAETRKLEIAYPNHEIKVIVSEDLDLKPSFHNIEGEFKGYKYLESTYSPIKKGNIVTLCVYFKFLDVSTIYENSSNEELENLKEKRGFNLSMFQTLELNRELKRRGIC